MLKYSITMGIRLVCIIACFFVPGYWIIIPAIGAVVLPYVAVVLANVSGPRSAGLVSPNQLALPPVTPEDPEDTTQ
jgi:hypothetical protein